MSNSTAFCYIMFMMKQRERETNTRANFFNWRNCFLWKNMTSQYSFFGSGRYGTN